MTDKDKKHEHRRHYDRDDEPPSSRGGRGSGGEGGDHGRGHGPWTVTGVVLKADGTPAPGTSVALVRKRLRHETELGTATSGEDGRYTIRYTPPRDGASVDLVARALTPAGGTIVESPILFDASAHETINLSLAGAFRPPSAWTWLLARLQPELDGVAIVDLEQSKQRQDISFLAAAIQHDAKDVADLVIASKLQPRTVVSAEVFYALFRLGVPTTLDAALDSLDTVAIDETFLKRVLADVLEVPNERVDSTLRAAVADNVVPATLLDTLPDELPKLQALRVQHVGSTPYIRGKTPLTTVLSTGCRSDRDVRTVGIFAKGLAFEGA
jgi:hypothetical protein